MKKLALYIFIGIVIFILSYIVYLNYMHTTYVDRTIKTYTQINNFKIIRKIHDDHQWYAKISIAENEGEKLLKLYPFKHGYTTQVIVGKSQNDYIKNCPDCLYYLDDKAHGIYGYVLYCLSEDKKQLEVYEEFGD